MASGDCGQIVATGERLKVGFLEFLADGQTEDCHAAPGSARTTRSHRSQRCSRTGCFPDFILSVVESQFREIREQLNVQVVRTGADRHHRELAETRDQLKQVRACSRSSSRAARAQQCPLTQNIAISYPIELRSVG